MRVAPLTREDAFEMMHEIKAAKFLQGARGRKPVNSDKLADMIVRVSNLMLKEKKIQEIDFNPVIANDNEVLAVDVRMMV